MLNITQVSFSYKDTQRLALDNLHLHVDKGCIFGLLGPNGGGKTTLFKMISTLVPVQQGSIEIFGLNLKQDAQEIRKKMGVVFQVPSLDKKLTVEENLRYQGYLYGLQGKKLSDKIDAGLEQVGLSNRRKEKVETLSGGLQRRVEIAKSLLHEPQLLVMDEPTTGLDPGSRRDFWAYIKHLQKSGMTVLVTTHLMEEAEQCDRLAILNLGKLVVTDTPAALKQKIGGEVLTLQVLDQDEMIAQIEKRFGKRPEIFNNQLRLEIDQAHQFVPELVRAFPEKIISVTVSKPNLEDVFVHFTGHQFWEEKPTQ